MCYDYKKEIGRNLRDIRLSRGFKQHELAEKAGVEDKTISRIEVGGNYPSLNLLVKLANVLNCNLMDFVRTETDDAVKSSIKELNANEIQAVKKFIGILNRKIQ